MKKVLIFTVILAVLAGCASTANQFGFRRDVLTGQGKKMLVYTDPSRPVDSGQVAYQGVNGPSGPYAAALGLGSIDDPSARQDAKEVMQTISNNEGWGGYGGGWRGGRGLAVGGAIYRGGSGLVKHGYFVNRRSGSCLLKIDGRQEVLVPARQATPYSLTAIDRHVVEILVPEDSHGSRWRNLRTVTVCPEEEPPSGLVAGLPGGGSVPTDWVEYID